MSAVSRHKYLSLITEVLCMLMFFYTAGNHSKWRKVGEIFTVGFSPSVRWPSGNGRESEGSQAVCDVSRLDCKQDLRRGSGGCLVLIRHCTTQGEREGAGINYIYRLLRANGLTFQSHPYRDTHKHTHAHKHTY